MKKKISLPVMAVSAILLLGGCGTQMYDLSEDEENLVVQYSAHILAKYNIEQKDGRFIRRDTGNTKTGQPDAGEPEYPECGQQHGVRCHGRNPDTGDGDDADRRGNRTCIGSDRFLLRIQGSEYLSGGRLFCSNS